MKQGLWVEFMVQTMQDINLMLGLILDGYLVNNITQ